MAHAKLRGFAFTALPVMVDPAAAAVAVTIRNYADPAAPGEDSSQDLILVRIPPLVTHALTFDPGVPANFYADAADVTTRRFALAYDVTGLLVALYYPGDEAGNFVVERFSEEVTGAPVRKPSLRIVFDTDEDCQAFAQAVQDLRTHRALPIEAEEAATVRHALRVLTQLLLAMSEPMRPGDVTQLSTVPLPAPR